MESNNQGAVCFLPDISIPDISQDCEEIIQYEIGLSPPPEYHFLSDWKSIPYDYPAVRFVTIRRREHFQEIHFQFQPRG